MSVLAHQRRLLSLLLGLLLLARCSDAPVGPCCELPVGLVVSGPVRALSLVANTAPTWAVSRSESDSSAPVVYISLSTGTVPGGSLATVYRVGDRDSLITAVLDGGFDPVPIVASAGDSVEVRVTDAGGNTLFQKGAAIAAVKAPIVVRTSPPPRKRDVPLNASIVDVFSEPVVTTTDAIQLFRGEFRVTGSVDVLQGTSTTVVFVPSAPLAANTSYRLVVTQAVRDLAGNPLEAAYVTEFETGTAQVGAVRQVSVVPATVDVRLGGRVQLTAIARDHTGTPLAGIPVTWSSDDPTLAAVSPSGLVTTLSLGLAHIRADFEGVTGAAALNIFGDQIAYTSLYSPDWLIFVMNADRPSDGDLSFNKSLAEGEFPNWSPDGTRIAFLSARDGYWNIYAVNADGSGIIRLTNDSAYADHDYSWSPDGSRLAFSAGRLTRDIFVINTDGTGLTRLTTDSLSDFAPAWSPDGSKIAFSSNRDTGDGYDLSIYVMTADGSDAIRLTNDSARDSDPNWSPDGSKLAFTRDWPSDTSKSGVHVMNADGSGLQRISQGHSPRWSPDGTKILFLGMGIGVSDPNGSGLHRIAVSYDSNPITSPAGWSPDGTKIAFVNLGWIWVVNADGSGLQNLTPNNVLPMRTPAWRPRTP